MLSFNEEKHIYTDPLSNKIIPNVTSILGDVGVIDSQWFTEESRIRGTYVHLATQYLDLGVLDKRTIDPLILPYVEAYEKFKRQTGFDPKVIEEVVYNRDLQYCGTLDRIGILQGNVILLDIKTGCLPRWSGLQTAAYQYAYKGEYKIVKRFCLNLKDNGNYRFTTNEDYNDFSNFCNCLNVYKYKRAV